MPSVYCLPGSLFLVGFLQPRQLGHFLLTTPSGLFALYKDIILGTGICLLWDMHLPRGPNLYKAAK